MSDFCKERTPVEVPPTTGTVVNCSICGEELLSKRKLFTHLEEVHDFVNENAKPVKVGCLVGWISSETSDVERYLRTESEEESREDLLTGNGTTKRKVETLLFDAIREVFDTKATTAKDNDENKGESKDKEDSSNSNSNRVGTGSGHTKSSSAISAEGSTARLAGHTKGLTRGSQPERSTVSHALERTSHSIADLFLFQLQVSLDHGLSLEGYFFVPLIHASAGTGPLQSLDLALSSILFSIYIPSKHFTNKYHTITSNSFVAEATRQRAGLAGPRQRRAEGQVRGANADTARP